MELINGGLKSRIESKEQTGNITCQCCHKTTPFFCFSTFDSIVLFAIPIGKFNDGMFAVCPECASVYAMDDNCKSYLKDGMGQLIDMNNLTLIKDMTKVTPQEKA